MTTKHTPGPWRVITRERTSKPDRFGRATNTRDVFINGGDGLGSIAKLYVGHEKDARLIAAAPELLAALDAVLYVLNADKDGDYFICKEAQPQIDAARTVIAKARGDAS